MKLPDKLLKDFDFNASPENVGHMLTVMDKSRVGAKISQPLRLMKNNFKSLSNSKLKKLVILMLRWKNIKFFPASILGDEGFNRISFPSGVYEEVSYKEIKSNFIEKS